MSTDESARPRLDDIEKRVSEATAGNWSTRDGLDEFGDDGLPDIVVNSEWLVDALIPHADADATFIAHARTDVPALTAALREVLTLHVDGGQSQGYTADAPGGYGYIDHCCTECGSFGEYGEPWPCQTVRAITAHIDLTDPEGDPR